MTTRKCKKRGRFGRQHHKLSPTELHARNVARRKRANRNIAARKRNAERAPDHVKLARMLRKNVDCAASIYFGPTHVHVRKQKRFDASHEHTLYTRLSRKFGPAFADKTLYSEDRTTIRIPRSRCTEMLNAAIHFRLRRGEIDWRVNGVLPEDLYAL